MLTLIAWYQINIICEGINSCIFRYWKSSLTQSGILKWDHCISSSHFKITEANFTIFKVFLRQEINDKPNANHPSKLQSVWIPCLPNIFKSKTSLNYMITHINWCNIFQIYLNHLRMTSCLMTTGFSLTDVEQVEMKAFNCRSWNQYGSNFYSFISSISRA